MDDKRRKLTSPVAVDPYALDGSDEDSYKPYVPVKKRREAQFAQLESRHSVGSAALDRKRKQEEADAEEVEGKLAREGPKGNAITLLIEAQEVKRLKAIRGTTDPVCGVYFID
jgi:ATP-dependent RNA helicase DDX41